MIDSYTVTRFVPYEDKKGNVSRSEFWLSIKCAGYQEDYHYSHMIKVVDWYQDDDWNLDLTDDRRRVFHIEMIFPDQDVKESKR